MASPWVWSESARRYRNPRTGQFIGQTQMLALRDTYVAAQEQSAANLAQRVVQGDMPLESWHGMMRADVKDSFISQYVLGHGGRGSMTQADWGRVGAVLKAQYRYLDGFAQAIADGQLSEAQIANRAAMYHGSSVAAYERGSALGRGMPDLPAYPGDGSTRCHSNCRCHWDVREVEGGWDAHWILDPGAENCPDCQRRSVEWAPYEVRP
jgi:hypothetical protein